MILIPVPWIVTFNGNIGELGKGRQCAEQLSVAPNTFQTDAPKAADGLRCSEAAQQLPCRR